MNSKRQIATDLTTETICFLFIILFVYAGLTKLLDFEKFVIQIGQSPMLTAYSKWVAWIIPILEIAIALLLVFKRARLIALYASFALMVVFTAYIIVIMNFSPYVPCSCGGVLQNMGWKEHLVFNVGFVVLGIAGILLQSKTDVN